MKLSVLGLAALFTSGCVAMGAAATGGTAEKDRGTGGMFHSAPEIAAPARDRCEGLGPKRKESCEQVRYVATNFARKLAVTDEVCLEGGIADPVVGGSCLARAVVMDTATGKVLVEIRDAKPDSKWFDKVQRQFWFAEGALSDLYLAEEGF